MQQQSIQLDYSGRIWVNYMFATKHVEIQWGFVFVGDYVQAGLFTFVQGIRSPLKGDIILQVPSVVCDVCFEMTYRISVPSR